MPIGFSYYARRYLTEADQLRQSMDGPVLFWEKPLAEHLEQPWLGTASGAPMKAPRAGEPVVFELKKTPGKANAFAMGVTLGRIDSNDIVIEDASISRFHAYFQKEARGDEWVLVDAESKNGTWLGPMKLKANERAKLTDGARIRVGDIELVFLSVDALFKKIRDGLGN